MSYQPWQPQGYAPPPPPKSSGPLLVLLGVFVFVCFVAPCLTVVSGGLHVPRHDTERASRAKRLAGDTRRRSPVTSEPCASPF